MLISKTWRRISRVFEPPVAGLAHRLCGVLSGAQLVVDKQGNRQQGQGPSLMDDAQCNGYVQQQCRDSQDHLGDGNQSSRMEADT